MIRAPGLWKAFAAAGLALAMFPLSAARAGPPTPGQRVWMQRCQSCHEPAVGYTPDRSALSARPRQAIEDALTGGSMKAMASGLNAEDIRALADYLTSSSVVPAPEPAESPKASETLAAAGQCATNPPIRPGPSDWASQGADEHSSR